MLKHTLRLAALALSVSPVAAADINVVVSGAPSADGLIEIGLCTEETWLKDGCDRLSKPASLEPVSFRFENVKPGEYAITAIHDFNADGKLDLRWYGAPKEFYGASNNPKKRRGPDRWKGAKFTVSDGDAEIQMDIVLRGWGESRRD